jgi:hypothetical protein
MSDHVTVLALGSKPVFMASLSWMRFDAETIRQKNERAVIKTIRLRNCESES